MERIANVALGVAVGCVVGCATASLIIHRRVWKAVLTGQPVPEMPEWHKKWHPLAK